MSALPLLALTLGDPAGIGPEIVQRVLDGDPAAYGGAALLVIGDEAALARERERLGAGRVLEAVSGPAEMRARGLALARLAGSTPLARLPAYGGIDAEAGRACHAWVVHGAQLALAGEVDALVTGPIHKGAWHAAGIEAPGHTEVLQDVAGVDRVVMMLAGGPLRVALATIHLPLREVPGRLTEAGLLADLVILDRALREGEGLARPRIGVLGLNPHAGEGGRFGDEEARILEPAIEAARAAGIDARGPLPADAGIPQAVAGHHDAVLCMYHDQGLPTVKALAPRKTVNLTLGLPFVRTSVDHGTAFDIAGRGVASEESLQEALRVAGLLSTRSVPPPT